MLSSCYNRSEPPANVSSRRRPNRINWGPSYIFAGGKGEVEMAVVERTEANEEPTSIAEMTALSDLDLVLTNLSLLISQGCDGRLTIIYDELLSIKKELAGEHAPGSESAVASPEPSSRTEVSVPFIENVGVADQKDCMIGKVESRSEPHSTTIDVRTIVSHDKSRRSGIDRCTAPRDSVKISRSNSRPDNGPKPIEGVGVRPAASGTKKILSTPKGGIEDGLPPRIMVQDLQLPLSEEVRSRLKVLGYVIIDR